MQKARFSEYEVNNLVAARKIASPRPIRNTLFAGDRRAQVQEMVVALYRKDSPLVDLTLIFSSSVRLQELSGVKERIMPSALMRWHGKRIRAIEHNITHDVVENGFPTGRKIRGYHEHYWTDADEDKRIREPDPPIGNIDIFSLLKWCSLRWNIDGLPIAGELFS